MLTERDSNVPVGGGNSKKTMAPAKDETMALDSDSESGESFESSEEI